MRMRLRFLFLALFLFVFLFIKPLEKELIHILYHPDEMSKEEQRPYGLWIVYCKVFMLEMYSHIGERLVDFEEAKKDQDLDISEMIHDAFQKTVDSEDRKLRIQGFRFNANMDLWRNNHVFCEGDKKEGTKVAIYRKIIIPERGSFYVCYHFDGGVTVQEEQPMIDLLFFDQKGIPHILSKRQKKMKNQENK